MRRATPAADRRGRRRAPGPSLQHPADGGPPEMRKGLREHGGESCRAHRRAEPLQPPHDVCDEVQEPVHGLDRLRCRPAASRAEQGHLVLQAGGGSEAVGRREQGDPGQGERAWSMAERAH